MTGTVTPDDVDHAFRVLGARERRRTLRYLQVHEKSSVAELADVLSGWRSVDRGEMTGPADRAGIETALLHVHLPKLVDAGLITYDPAAGTVSATELPGWVGELLDVSFEATDEATADETVTESRSRY
jgi:DNA-binding transcriptional ArsR family regulator